MLWLTLNAVKSFQVSVFVEIVHTQIGEVDFGAENLVHLTRNHISSWYGICCQAEIIIDCKVSRTFSQASALGQNKADPWRYKDAIFLRRG